MSRFRGRKTQSEDDKAEYSASRVDWDKCVCKALFQTIGHPQSVSHASAIKTILRYLKKTADEGITIKPADSRFNLELYVDADFCGLFGREDPRDPNSVRSRTGYIAMLCGWPIVWKSALQMHLSQSTLKAKYSALSSLLHVFLPLK